MKTYFMINIKNINELTESIKIAADKRIKPMSFKIIHTINISDEEFDFFSNNLQKNHKFLYPYIDQMYFENDGTLRCILVKAENSQKILCFNSGCAYPKFLGIYDDNLIGIENN